MQKYLNYIRKILKRKEKNQGITLIALVITVIILLILAGTAITLSINGGNLFSKTNEAAYEWNTAVAREESALSNVFEILDMAANPDLAKYKLTVKVNHDENGNETTAESPYYVWYPSAKYINESSDENCKGIKCRVLYNDSTYGLQLISADYVTAVKLGKNDSNENVEGEMGSIERAQNSYMRAITTLNEKAEEYIETENGSTLAIDARCVGSKPLNKNFPDNLMGDARTAEMFVADDSVEYMKEYNGKFFKEDNNCETDYEMLAKIGCKNLTSGKTYWLASRATFNNSEYGYYFCPVYMGSSGYRAIFGFLRVNTDGILIEQETTKGLRPVFILAPEVKITGGIGTEESPFEIGL